MCNEGYTGPTCKASVAFDDIIWDKDEELPFSFLFMPAAFIWLILGMAISTVLVVFYKYSENMRIRQNYAYNRLDNQSYGLGLELGSRIWGNNQNNSEKLNNNKYNNNDNNSSNTILNPISVGLPISYQKETVANN
jgi:hypothetical protein